MKGNTVISGEHITPRDGRLSYSTFCTVLITKLLSVLFYIFITITALAIFIPFNPTMPSRPDSSLHFHRPETRSLDLDPSWILAVNEAVAQHMRFGKGFMFTSGPYTSVLTRSYHPATDRRMMFGSLLVCVSYVIALLFLARDRRRYLVIILLYLATFCGPEMPLILYPFVLVVCALMYVNSDNQNKTADPGWWQILTMIVMLSTLGLLPLVKETLFVPVGVSGALLATIYLSRFRLGLTSLLLLVPVLAFAVFWTIAGLPLTDIPAFMRNTTLLTSGYTEAMSTPWVAWPSIVGHGFVLIYLGLSALICISISRSTQITVASKWVLGCLCIAYLLIAFKHGFVRADHVSIAFATLLLCISIIGFLYIDRYLIWALSIAMILILVMSIRGDPVLGKEVIAKYGLGTASSGAKRGEILAFCSGRAIVSFSRVTYTSTWNTYHGAWEGLRLRMSKSNALKDGYKRAIADIRNDYPLPALTGTSDIYSYEQTVLIASNNKWDPRPIFQSYSAYTPVLMRLNEQHLRGPDAPDWVLFKLQSVDGRLPSLDDGLSWPALLDNYTFTSYDGEFVLMHKNQFIHSNSSYDECLKQTYKIGTTVRLPETDGLLFAEVELKPTLLGRLQIALYQPPQLYIVLSLGNGRTTSYRIISNMMTTEFLLSPYISDTGEFASLMAGNERSQDETRVQSISIAPSYGGSVLWSGTYTLTLKRYLGELGPGSSMLYKSTKATQNLLAAN